MKKYILTLAAFFFLSVLLFGQDLTRQELIDINRNRVDRIVKNKIMLPFKLQELRGVGLFQLDSIVSGAYDHVNGQFETKKFKDEYSYDEYGNPDTGVFYYYWEGKYELLTRTIFTCNDQEQILQSLTQDYYAQMEEWEDFWKNIYEYDDRGNLIKEASYSWSSTEWELEVEKQYQYNPDNLFLGYSVRSFGYYSSSYKIEFTYDEEGNLHTETFFDWNGSSQSWEEERKTIYLYNDLNLLVSETINESQSGSLTLDRKTSFNYDEKARLSEEISYKYSNENTWEAYRKKEYVYKDESSSLPILINIFSLSEESEWIPSRKEEITLDDRENVLGHTRYYYISDNNWRPEYLYVFNRDDEITLDELSTGSLYWMEDGVFRALEDLELPKGPNAMSSYSEYFWNSATDSWEYEYMFNESFFYYSEVSSSTDVEEASISPDFLAYPNPADRLLTIETDLTNAPFDLYLYNMFGQRVFRKNISANEQVVLPDLPEGIYLLQLSKESHVFGSRRIIIGH